MSIGRLARPNSFRRPRTLLRPRAAPPTRRRGSTPIERRLGSILGSLRLPYWPHHRYGGFELDFALRDHLLDLEADGELYHSSLEAARRRDRRDVWLESNGYRVLHLTGSVIMNDDPLVRRLVLQEVALSRPRPPLRVADLRTGSEVAISLRVLSIGPERRTAGGGTLRVAMTEDDSGRVPLELWDGQWSGIAAGQAIRLEGAWVNEHSRRPSLYLSRRGSIRVTDDSVRRPTPLSTATERPGAQSSPALPRVPPLILDP